jgi:very-short-patch-repair endonuclease
VACGVSVDLLVCDEAQGKRVALFIDADRAVHRPPDTPERVDQHSLLERAGWTVARAPATEWLPEMAATVERVAVDEADLPIPDASLLDLDIAAEDRADYHWDAPPVERRLAAGEDVFQSGFERDLYTALARVDGLNVVPQWPSRGKSIDLVVTDRDGRRLAVEADGAQHHETETGDLIPEDLERQAFLEQAGWNFCRIRHDDFHHDPELQVKHVLDALARQPTNAELAELVWTDEAVQEALATPVETDEPHRRRGPTRARHPYVRRNGRHRAADGQRAARPRVGTAGRPEGNHGHVDAGACPQAQSRSDT